MCKRTCVLAAVIVFCGYVHPVSACLNDRDTVREERQFKSLYPDIDKQSPEISPEAAPAAERLLAFGGPIVGVGLMGAAGFVTYRRRIA